MTTITSMQPLCDEMKARAAVWKGEQSLPALVTPELGCCCCSHINSNNQVRGHRTGSSHSGAEEYPREKTQTKGGTRIYIRADAIHASTRKI